MRTAFTWMTVFAYLMIYPFFFFAAEKEAILSGNFLFTQFDNVVPLSGQHGETHN